MDKSKLTINEAVFKGICKTINRFREHPFLYFTESDLHASLSRDIMEGNSDLFIIGKEMVGRSTVKIPVSLIHHEYPTNFRYENSKLRENGYSNDDARELTKIDGSHGDRGNYDLVILNRDFIEKLFSENGEDLMAPLMHIINKDIKRALLRNTKNEVLFAIEVKFIHPFNAGNKQMEVEVKKDLNKLYLSLKHSDNFIMPINLVFCSSNYIQSNNNSVIDNIKKYLEGDERKGVCSIFIESYFSNNTKKTIKPIVSFNPIEYDKDWASGLKTKFSNEL